MVVYNGKLIVGGGFPTAGGFVVNNIASFNGTQWDSLGTGTNGTVTAMAVHNNELFVAGSFDTVGGVAAKHITMASCMSADISHKQVVSPQIILPHGMGQHGAR
jgi:hypothetical protein